MLHTEQTAPHTFLGVLLPDYMHCIIKTQRQKAWDDGVPPSPVNYEFSCRLNFFISIRAISLTGQGTCMRGVMGGSQSRFTLNIFSQSHFTLIFRPSRLITQQQIYRFLYLSGNGQVLSIDCSDAKLV